MNKAASAVEVTICAADVLQLECRVWGQWPRWFGVVASAAVPAAAGARPARCAYCHTRQCRRVTAAAAAGKPSCCAGEPAAQQRGVPAGRPAAGCCPHKAAGPCTRSRHNVRHVPFARRSLPLTTALWSAEWLALLQYTAHAGGMRACAGGCCGSQQMSVKAASALWQMTMSLGRVCSEEI